VCHEPCDVILRFLDQIDIGQCTLCQCYFHLWDTEVLGKSKKSKGKSWIELSRITQFDFNVSGAKSTDSPYSIISNGHWAKRDLQIWRYLCMNCVLDLSNNLSRWASKVALAK
jgi:hypothetical protein